MHRGGEREGAVKGGGCGKREGAVKGGGCGEREGAVKGGGCGKKKEKLGHISAVAVWPCLREREQ